MSLRISQKWTLVPPLQGLPVEMLTKFVQISPLRHWAAEKLGGNMQTRCGWVHWIQMSDSVAKSLTSWPHMQIMWELRVEKELGGNKAAGPCEWRNAGLSGLFQRDKHFKCWSNARGWGVAALYYITMIQCLKLKFKWFSVTPMWLLLIF